MGKSDTGDIHSKPSWIGNALMAREFGFMQFSDGATDVNALDFMARMIAKKSVMVAKIVKVVAVNAASRTVDVSPMVDQVTPEGTNIPHGIIHEVPYGYEQAGNCAIKIDPVEGDIGVVVFEDRDITRVKRTWKNATPQTLRAHNYADALYVRTLIAAAKPEHTVTFNQENGITVTSSKPVQFNADVTVSGKVTVSGDVDAQGDVKAGSISLKDHTHPVTDAPGTTGAPQ